MNWKSRLECVEMSKRHELDEARDFVTSKLLLICVASLKEKRKEVSRTLSVIEISRTLSLKIHELDVILRLGSRSLHVQSHRSVTTSMRHLNTTHSITEMHELDVTL